MKNEIKSVVYICPKRFWEVEVFTPFVEGGENDYTGCEMVNDQGEWMQEIGCWFEGGVLSDYDGVAVLQMVVIIALRKAGYTVPRSFEHDLN